MRLVAGRSLSPDAQSRVSQLGTENPSSSLAVLSYKLDPELRHFSLALKGYNENFLLLHDTAEASGGDLGSIFVSAPLLFFFIVQ